MTTITKERLLTIKQWRETYGPGSNVVLPAEEAEELARIALASLEAKPIGAFHIAEQQVDGTSDYIKDGEWPIDNGIIEVYAAPPVPVVPGEIADDLMEKLPKSDAWANGFRGGWNACRAVMLQSGNFRKIPEASTSSPVTPPLLPGGFTIEDAKELHEDLVRSHISQALSGEKMKKKDREADLRWIHGVIVQAAWFVKASLEQNALSGNSPVTPDSWISCSERMPEETGDIIVVSDGIVMSGISYSRRDGFYMAALEYDDDEPIDGVTHWMPLPEPPQG
ncbi:DUF551 domain-containing protein [Escherichia coli]|nr:DUF551 domain-containing protein [Escherichia coli]EJS9523521.1 DUF551 domain-containing protein [Escherichia coli]KMV60467.1 dTDP-6-deoxy-L-hexose 3-O-methyltransferase [Escherichia coli]MBB8622732.1 DUF551 domain-containing protein [Escherichia coli]HBA3851184.1 DUF551 domain-containing protein [Escherichia coli]